MEKEVEINFRNLDEKGRQWWERDFNNENEIKAAYLERKKQIGLLEVALMGIRNDGRIDSSVQKILDGLEDGKNYNTNLEEFGISRVEQDRIKFAMEEIWADENKVAKQVKDEPYLVSKLTDEDLALYDLYQAKNGIEGQKEEAVRILRQKQEKPIQENPNNYSI